MTDLPRPFLKWVGGKTQLLPELLKGLPDFGNYHEPFLGGGALFWALYRDGKLEGKRALLSDANRELVHTYRAVRRRVDEVISDLASQPTDEEWYYSLRDQDPFELSLHRRAARMIALNKTGFNGLYRVNADGEFNVPWGKRKNPTICDEDNLRACSAALACADVLCGSFEIVLDHAEPGDLVYFDPPYMPVADDSFTAFTAGGFGGAEHERLRDVFFELAGRGVHVMLSNSDTAHVRQMYGPRIKEIRRHSIMTEPRLDHTYRLDTIKAARAINSDGAGRGQVNEILVRSWA